VSEFEGNDRCPPPGASPVWSHRVGDSEIAAFERPSRNGPFLVFRLTRLYHTGTSWARTSSLRAQDLPTLRPLITAALRFARTWRP